ncbi:DUF6763 family protein [Microbulbifer halophilus]|uniref:DUF6763 family protein n=1 Tax=Microbulbifer halophilus TaxID=453963 RepID=A0ABW5ELM7_9GAMM|nr:DUF6763 family protein [Microbulbifer halophilus]MCW8128524.1 hypothetical protein [Microbulbifer halophilus]
MAEMQPDIGNWFENIEDGTLFEVVAVDDLERTLEVQYQDGTVGEFDLDQWQSLPVVDAAPPEDANVAYGLAARELAPDTGQVDFNNPLDSIEGESFGGTDESSY